ncbi:MAG: SDR family oxidoreductase [Xanthomonadales bacterium]|nr:SDR family oxidoreductase [Xanthomonadales bacterium]
MDSASRKTALITGGSGGIGHAIAREFVKHGVDVIITGRDKAGMEALAAQWRSEYGVEVTGLAAELSHADGARALFDAVAATGVEIDYLVNNAGVGLFGEFADSDLDAALRMMHLNMDAPTVLCKLFLPQLVRRRGKIMNIASTAAFQPGPYMAVYYATKAFVLSLSEALACELAGSGVSVTTFCPGPTASGFQDKAAMQKSGLVKGKAMPSAEAVGMAGYRAMLAGKRVVIPGMLNKLLAFCIRFMPRSWVTALVKAISAPK